MRTSSLRRSRSSTERKNFDRYRRLIDSHKNRMQLFSEIVDLRARKGGMESWGGRKKKKDEGRLVPTRLLLGLLELRLTFFLSFVRSQPII